MKYYHYFVSYIFEINFQFGVGNCDVYRKTKILNCKDITEKQCNKKKCKYKEEVK